MPRQRTRVNPSHVIPRTPVQPQAAIAVATVFRPHLPRLRCVYGTTPFVKESHVFNTCNTLRKLTLALPIIGAVLALGAGTAPASAAPAAPPSAAAAAQANIAGQALP